MIHVIKDKSDVFITIALIISASAIKAIFGEDNYGIVISGLIVFLAILAYQLTTYLLFGAAVFSPLKWLYFDNSTMWPVPSIKQLERRVSDESRIIILTQILFSIALTKLQ